MSIRNKIWSKLRSNVLEGEMLPKWLLVIRFFLFPLQTIVQIVYDSNGYDIRTDTWMIDGQRFSTDFFRTLEENEGKKFRITRKKDLLFFERLF